MPHAIHIYSKAAREALERLACLDPDAAADIAAVVDEIARLRPHPKRSPFGSLSDMSAVPCSGFWIVYRETDPVRILRIEKARF